VKHSLLASECILQINFIIVSSAVFLCCQGQGLGIGYEMRLEAIVKCVVNLGRVIASFSR
jgi:hypothetical protein